MKRPEMIVYYYTFKYKKEEYKFEVWYGYNFSKMVTKLEKIIVGDRPKGIMDKKLHNYFYNKVKLLEFKK